MTRRFAVACIVGLLLITGCAVDQAKEVATYRGILDRDEPPIAALAPGQPLSLEHAMMLANQHNERLGLQGEEYLQALIAKDRAAAGFLPTISLAPTYFRQDPVEAATRPEDSEGGGGARSFLNRRLDVPVNARMNLFNGFSDLASLRGAARTIEQQRALLLDAQAAVLLDVAQVYYQILRSERLVEVLRNSLAVQEERLRDTRGRREAGFARPLDVAQTEAQASATRVALIAARNDVENGRAVLSLLIGVSVEDRPLEDTAALPPSLPVLNQLIEAALAQREDLAAARAGIEAARQDVQAAIGQYYPSISVNVNYFVSRESSPSESDWNALLSANLPIFSAGLIHADVRAAWSGLRQTQLAESLTRRRIVQEVEVSHHNLVASRQRLEQLQVQLQAAEEALRQAEESYRVGLATNLDRLTAQDILLTTQLQLASERFDQKTFYLNLLRATGRLSTRLPGQPPTAPAPLPDAAPAALDVYQQRGAAIVQNP